MKKPQQPASFARWGEFSEGITRLIELFEEHEATLQFPGVNAQSLREQVEALEQCQKDVENQEALAAEARERLVLCTARLLDRARQAQAYAEVFVSAQTDDAADKVRAGLSGIELASDARANRSRKPRAPGAALVDPSPRRGKSSKSLSEVEERVQADDEVKQVVAAE